MATGVSPLGWVALKVASFGEGKETRASAWSLAFEVPGVTTGVGDSWAQVAGARGLGGAVRGTWMWVTGALGCGSHGMWISRVSP